MRALLGRVHRYAGLVLAGILFVAGITGSIIAFQEEIDRWLNPDLYQRATDAPSLPLDDLVAAVARQVGTSVNAVYLERPGENVLLLVEPQRGTAPGFDQVFADPVSGRVVGTRLWGECCLERKNVIPFLYTLHASLHLPGAWGTMLMGGVAILWLMECLVGFCLTLPAGWRNWRKWKSAWTLRPGAGGLRLGRDLHRAGGLWTWAILIVVASSGIALNLREPVFRPMVGMVAGLSPTPLDQAIAAGAADTSDRRLTFAGALDRARGHARALFPDPVAHYVRYDAELNTYAVALTNRNDRAHPLDGLGPSWLYVSASDGRVVARDAMGAGTAGDTYLQSQFSLHSGHILGIPGRALIALAGLFVAMLSVTGVYVWGRRRMARLSKSA